MKRMKRNRDPLSFRAPGGEMKNVKMQTKTRNWIVLNKQHFYNDISKITVCYIVLNLLCVLCFVYCVLCTVYCVLCTVYLVLCTMNCVLCTVYLVLCTMNCVLVYLKQQYSPRFTFLS